MWTRWGFVSEAFPYMPTKNTKDIDAALKLKAQGKSTLIVAAAGPVPVKVVVQEVIAKTEVPSKQVEVANRTEVDGRVES